MSTKKNKEQKRSARKTKKGARPPKPACGLCGSTKRLTRTECCGNWICDDEHEYVMFSYARNSCYRNHRRYTLCGFHHAEGHEGRWQDCDKCRETFETEMYVHYGTNEYNFETLPNPPAYEPTKCHTCGQVIVLGDGGYSTKGGDYFCQNCSAMSTDEPFLKLHNAKSEVANSQHQAEREIGHFSSQAQEDNAIDNLQEWLDDVPDTYAARFCECMRLTDTFCDTHLNLEYKELCREMAVDVCQNGSPVLKGKAEGWAAGIVYSLGRINFLDDPSQTPHMKSKQIAEGFGVSVATMQAKSKVIREGLDLFPFHPDWCLTSLQENNPLTWMLEVNGFIMDIRTAPRDVQVAAYEEGLIPYIPSDQNK
ncbi:MAG: hypothetical protein JW741_12390 [Sedimentisphaerales bacterium]|nr:hypothetical protein [Sedimentisphaerales bacterium]